MTSLFTAALALLLLGTNWVALPLPADSSSRPVESAGAATAPARPRGSVETAAAATTGRTIAVAANGDLQAALHDAKPGDRITLEPGATYTGPFRLLRKEGTGWITISSASDANLPKPGARLDPARARPLPKLVASSGSVIHTEPGAHHYRLVGLEIAPADGVFLRDLVQLGADESDLSLLPHHIVIDRSYIHGDPTRGSRRGVALNSRDSAVIDSHLSGFKEVGADSQAIAGWNGPGPFKISNNYLEAAGENVMFGGADPRIRDLVPSDIEIVRNHMSKPLGWKADDPRFEGTAWSVKNLFELKNARRVLVDGNVLEYNWPHAQNGFAILFTVRNQDGGSPWSVVEDVTFTNNIVRHVAAGINILGQDDIHPSQQTRRIAVRNNLFLDVGGRWGSGRLLQLLDGTRDVTVEHNTALQTSGVVFGGDRTPHAGFVFRDNITLHNSAGISGSSVQTGRPTLERYFPGAVVRRNVIVGGTPDGYPSDNFFPRSLDEVGNVATRGDDFRLALAAQYVGAASDGRDPGADMDALARATKGVALATNAQVEDDPLAGLLVPPGSGGAAGVFWTALLLLAYIYVGYPAIARIRASLWPKSRIRAPIEPTVSIVVVAYNEGRRIRSRLHNLLALDYPRDRLEIIVGSDGSTDDTVVEARRFEDRGVRVQPFRERRGKSAVLNAVVPLTHGEIVVFADARQHFDRGALRALVAGFADPSAGAVSGSLVLRPQRSVASASHGTAFYWRYEKFIRSTEARSDSTVGATGAIYAIRRALFEPIPEDTVLDDVLIPLQIMRRGYRVLFEPEARAYDRASATAREEFVRKARTIAGTFQLFARQPWLLHPRRNRLWFETISHKALRLGIPVLHALLLVANLSLLEGWIYQWAFAGQVAFYGAALAGCLQPAARRHVVLFSVPYTICLLGWATVVGFSRFVAQRQQVTWERVPQHHRRPPVPLPAGPLARARMPQPHSSHQ